MAHSPHNEAPPYAPFLDLEWGQRAIIMAGAVAAVVAFGFVPVSVQVVGGAGWPLHDVLHPLLGLFLGPIYGPVSAVVGAAMSEVLSPHTALGGWSPLAAGASSLISALLVRRRGDHTLLGGVLAASAIGLGAVIVWSDGLSSGDVSLLPVAGALCLAAIPTVRSWCRRHLASGGHTGRTALALYEVCFVGSALGTLPLWGVAGMGGSVSTSITAPLFFVAIRVLLPGIGALLGLALWPALQRRLLSVANQLRYGLPLFMLATFLFAGRLFVERAYEAARAETTERLQDQSQAVARTLDTELERIRKLLLTQTRAGVSPQRLGLFAWTRQVPATTASSDTLAPDVRALVRAVRRTGRPQRGFLAMPDTTAHGIGVAVPVTPDGTRARSDASAASVMVACIGPSMVQRTLAIWKSTQSHVYLVDRRHEPMVERAGAPAPAHSPGPLLAALLRAPGATAEAAQGRYDADVLGAVAPLAGLPGYVVVEQAQDSAYVHVLEMLLTMALIILLACGGALAVGFYVSRRVVHPLDRLIDAARRVGTGDLSVRVPVEQENELGELARTFNAMTGDLADSMKRLQANEERLRIALNAAQMGTWNWTANPERVTWSPQTYALLDVPRSRRENLLSAFLSRIHPADQTQVIERIRAVVDGQTRFAIEHRIRSRDGEERWVRLQGRVYRKDGRPRRMSGIIMDITTRKQAEQELKAAKEEAEEMSRLKSAFLANVSHEIRTPLTSIIGFAEVLVEEVPEAHQGGAEKIVQSGHRLMQTLDSVLDLSMIEAGEFSLDCRPFDLAAEVRQRAELLRPTAERKGLDLAIDVPASAVEVHLDPNCLDRILTNLLTNAIKFTEEGNVNVRVRTRPSAVVVQVADTGIGIGDDFQSELFEAFKQESGGLQREHQGTGLGLSITKELVDMMEGDIVVESQKGSGTTFTVRFPYRVSEARETVLRTGTAENL